MHDLFSDDTRRDPYPHYARIRAALGVIREPQSGLWMAFDYATVNRVLTDHQTFSSRHGPDWMIFTDPPRHAKLRAIVSRAFTPRSVAGLGPRIRELSRDLLDRVQSSGEMDLAADFAVPLPTLVIAEMLGIPAADRPRFTRWNDVLLEMSYTVPGGDGAAQAMSDFIDATGEMGQYLAAQLDRRRREPADDLLTRLVQAEVDGERLSPAELVGFFQLLLLAGSETTTNLITNAILCFAEHPDQLAKLRGDMTLLPSAIEEVLRFRAPLQWMYRKAARDVDLAGQTIPAGSLVLAVIGAANRDPAAFPDPDRFDVSRDPNPHLAFGHGAHFCLGAPLARLEARVALTDLLHRLPGLRLATDRPWPPRRGLHVLGPSLLPVRWNSASA